MSFNSIFYKRCLILSKKIKIYNKAGEEITKTMSFIICWQITINSMISFYDVLKNVGFQFVLTRRVNQDALENFFGNIFYLLINYIIIFIRALHIAVPI